MAYTLPKTFVVKSSYNNKYLAYIKDAGEVQGLLKFSTDDVSELTVFEVEPAKGNGNGLVHLRCSYSNKYWRRWSQNHWWIAAQADEPEEDRSKWSCTLFKPVFVDGDPNSLRLVHVQLGHYACLWPVGEPYANCLYAAGPNPNDEKLDILAITEVVSVSREITNVQFDLKDAKVYDKTSVEVGYGVAINNGFESNEVKTLTVEYNEDEFKSKGCWEGKSSLNSEVVTRLQSATPVLVEGKIELTGGKFTGPYQLGKTVVSTQTGQTIYDMVIPPRTEVLVTIKATRASFEVPFTFTRRDTLSGEKVLSFNKNTGVYKGVTHFDLWFEVEERARFVNKGRPRFADADADADADAGYI